MSHEQPTRDPSIDPILLGADSGDDFEPGEQWKVKVQCRKCEKSLPKYHFCPLDKDTELLSKDCVTCLCLERLDNTDAELAAAHPQHLFGYNERKNRFKRDIGRMMDSWAVSVQKLTGVMCSSVARDQIWDNIPIEIYSVTPVGQTTLPRAFDTVSQTVEHEHNTEDSPPSQATASPARSKRGRKRAASASIDPKAKRAYNKRNKSSSVLGGPVMKDEFSRLDYEQSNQISGMTLDLAKKFPVVAPIINDPAEATLDANSCRKKFISASQLLTEHGAHMLACLMRMLQQTGRLTAFHVNVAEESLVNFEKAKAVNGRENVDESCTFPFVEEQIALVAEGVLAAEDLDEALNPSAWDFQVKASEEFAEGLANTLIFTRAAEFSDPFDGNPVPSVDAATWVQNVTGKPFEAAAALKAEREGEWWRKQEEAAAAERERMKNEEEDKKPKKPRGRPSKKAKQSESSSPSVAESTMHAADESDQSLPPSQFLQQAIDAYTGPGPSYAAPTGSQNVAPPSLQAPMAQMGSQYPELGAGQMGPYAYGYGGVDWEEEEE